MTVGQRQCTAVAQPLVNSFADRQSVKKKGTLPVSAHPMFGQGFPM